MRRLISIITVLFPALSLAQDTDAPASDPSAIAPATDTTVPEVASEESTPGTPVLWWCDKGMAVSDQRCLQGFEMVEVSGGDITIGSADGMFSVFRSDRKRVERLDSSFWMTKTEVTQGQFEALMGFNPSETCAAKIHESLPVTCVSWNDAVAFANTLSSAASRTPVYEIKRGRWHRNMNADGFRLPTSLEWEHAARGGRNTRFSGADNPRAVAWFSENSRNTPEIVAKRMPNDLGLYDMSGNVWEWVWDSYVQQVLPKKGRTDSVDGALKMQRGGSYLDESGWLALTAIDYDPAEYYGPAVGFRLARNGTEVPAKVEAEAKSDESPKKDKKKAKKKES